VSSEVAGFAKTGGLADVAASLPAALAQRGIDIAVVMPLYRAARTAVPPPEPTSITVSVPIGSRQIRGSVWRSRLPETNVPIYFIDQPEFFDRDDPTQGRGLYQFIDPNGGKRDYADNCPRFVFFCRAVLEALPLLPFWPDIVHVNDWQSGLIPVYIKELYGAHPERDVRARYGRLHTMLTIHNIAFQGLFGHMDMPLTGLPWKLFNYEQLEFYGQVNFLKGGMVFADVISTVSPMYAKEIQTPYFGGGLQGVLVQRSRQLHGIVNGVDYRIWNPATDPHIAARYDETTVVQGKAVCKKALQEHYQLPLRPRTPLLGMVSRLVNQKGLDLLQQSAEALLEHDLQLVVLGEGDPLYHALLLKLRKQFPQKLGVTLAQDEKLAHQIEAGADIFLMPSQFEPCGLSQLYSLKYGTVPLVRKTGGLADTVVDAASATLAKNSATGFAFIPYTPAAFLETLKRALNLYTKHPDQWLALQRNGMRQDWSWNRSAAEYERLYSSLADDQRATTTD
jgi:starch synthase